MVEMRQSPPVRAVILRSAIGALGADDELHTTLEMQGLTAAWLPGDHGLCLMVGGGVVGGAQIEPAATVFIDPVASLRLARAISRTQEPRPAPLPQGDPQTGVAIGIGAPAWLEEAWGQFSYRRASIQMYKLGSYQKPAALPGRSHLVEINVHPPRIRVYLTTDEANDLKVVLKHQPAWHAR